MKKHRLKKSVGIFAMLIVAAGLLIFSTVGGARAALTYYSQTYSTQFDMFDIGITLLENDNPVHQRNFDAKDHAFHEAGSQLLLNWPEGQGFEFGKTYEEKLAVQNTGTIDEYVRLTVRKYWAKVSEDGTVTKRTDLDPSLIKVNFINEEQWLRDSQFSDDKTERTVLYYAKPIAKGEKTVPATDWITVDTNVKAVLESVDVQKSADGAKTVITTTYTYNGLNFVLEAEADGVQTHNAVDAIKSAWGRDVTVSADGTLSLND